jgi:hypothetical protein
MEQEQKLSKARVALEERLQQEVEESLNDDFRFPYDYWNPWEIVAR